MTTQYNSTHSPTTAWGPARITLAITTVALGLLAFLSSIVFLGGLSDHDWGWLLTGIAGVATATLAHYTIKRIIQKLAGYPVSLRD